MRHDGKLGINFIVFLLSGKSVRVSIFIFFHRSF